MKMMMTKKKKKKKTTKLMMIEEEEEEEEDDEEKLLITSRFANESITLAAPAEETFSMPKTAAAAGACCKTMLSPSVELNTVACATAAAYAATSRSTRVPAMVDIYVHISERRKEV